MEFDKNSMLPSSSQPLTPCMGDTGLLIIDMQHDFVSPDSALCVRGALSTIPTIRALLDTFRVCGRPIFHVIRAHAADGSDAEVYRRALFAQGKGLCVAGSAGAAIMPELTPLLGENVVIKTRFSGFYRTSLEDQLHKAGVSTVVIAGTQYPNCIRGTAMDALARDFHVVVVTDACSAQNQDVAKANIDDLCAMGIRCLTWAEFDDEFVRKIA